MAVFFAQKHFGSLRPADDQGADVLRKIKNGTYVTVEIKQPRNIQHHRLFWALANLVFENQEHYGSVKELVAALKVTTGHCQYIETRLGRVAIPKSISFGNMDQTEFNAFFDKCVNVICTQFLPGTDRQELKDEVLAMIGEPA